MASLGQVTLRAKRHHRDMGALGLSTTKAGARQRVKSRQREGCREPATPRKGSLAMLHLNPERCRPASTPRCSRKRAECVSTPGWVAAPARGRGAHVPVDPASPPLQPCCWRIYFSGLPADEQQDTAVPSLLAPAALSPALGRQGPMKTRSTPEPTLVLELEGTLVCSSMLAGWLRDAAATFTTAFQGDAYEVHLKLRPHVQQFLESLSKTYEIFVFTTAKQDYAEKVLDVLDPKRKVIRHCLSQRDCLCAGGCYWKDLSLLSRDLAKTVALDHTIQGFPSQAANWIPVPRWGGDPQDEELLRLIPLLGQLCQAGDVRAEIRRRFPLCKLLAED